MGEMWRQLSDEELFELDQKVQRRLAGLTEQGVQFSGVTEHYLTTLLATLCSERQLAKAREEHLMWVDARLDEAESQIRRAKFMQGVAGHNGGSKR